MPPAVPPAFAPSVDAAPRSRGRANGRIPDRFTGRSRVVPRSSSAAGLSAMSRLSVATAIGRVPIVAFRYVVGDTGLEPVISCMSGSPWRHSAGERAEVSISGVVRAVSRAGRSPTDPASSPRRPRWLMRVLRRRFRPDAWAGRRKCLASAVGLEPTTRRSTAARSLPPGYAGAMRLARPAADHGPRGMIGAVGRSVTGFATGEAVTVDGTVCDAGGFSRLSSRQTGRSPGPNWAGARLRATGVDQKWATTLRTRWPFLKMLITCRPEPVEKCW